MRNQIKPGPGQESVWDYPRPPRVEDTSHHIQILVQGEIIVDTYRAKRLLETSHPPVYYIPPQDVNLVYLNPNHNTTLCEWKGRASYFDLIVNDRRIQNAGWRYLSPTADFEALKSYLAFYPSKMDSCTVNGEMVTAQAGDFYGGWITKNIVGPFKGAAGTWGW